MPPFLFVGEDMTKYSANSREQLYRSQVIDLLTEIRDSLKPEIVEVTNEVAFLCGTCGREFKSEHGLKIHKAKCKEG